MIDPRLSLVGLVIGLLVGMTGMGGGALLTPLLILLFGFKPTLAVGTDILHGAIFKTFGAVRHRRLGSVHARMTAWMLVGSAPMSLVGVEVAEAIARRYGDGIESLTGKVVGAALVLGGLGFLAKTFVKRGSRPSDAPLVLRPRERAIALALGVGGGFIVGLTSVGSGTFFGLVMLIAFPLTAAKIVGTDIFHAAALLWVAGISHLLHGNVDLVSMGSLLLGSIPGVLAGSQLTVRMADRALRVGLGATLLLSGLKLLDVPGADPLILATLAGGLLLGLGVLVRSIARATVLAPPREL
ncbi:MAG: sulfite exporter TauE/SafE family protein [Actinobacteria bacterium]|nr:sulfite exporter TauE/SafE family protein [Actinomycetota bacterium]